MAILTPHMMGGYHALNKELTRAHYIMAGSLVNIQSAMRQLSKETKK